jgi:coenzyme PQQ biosynthesis protein PqqD
MRLQEQDHPALARGVRLRNDPSTGEPLLLFPEGVLHLSQTATEIVGQCDGKKSIAVMLTDLAQEYDVDPGTLRKDVLDCLQDLYERKLVVV